MEPGQSESNLKKQFTTVTPLSRYLAMVLFIAFPFVGFWVGLWYGEQKLSYEAGEHSYAPPTSVESLSQLEEPKTSTTTESLSNSSPDVIDIDTSTDSETNVPLGIDADVDGVWDDVEAKLQYLYGHDPELYALQAFGAVSYQSLLAATSSLSSATRSMKLYVGCLEKFSQTRSYDETFVPEQLTQLDVYIPITDERASIFIRNFDRFKDMSVQYSSDPSPEGCNKITQTTIDFEYTKPDGPPPIGEDLDGDGIWDESRTAIESYYTDADDELLSILLFGAKHYQDEIIAAYNRDIYLFPTLSDTSDIWVSCLVDYEARHNLESQFASNAISIVRAFVAGAKERSELLKFHDYWADGRTFGSAGASYEACLSW